MWTVKTNCRCVLILGCLALLPILGGCGQRDLTREKAAEMMNQQYAEKLANACALDAALMSKPEFAAIASEPVCEAEFVVTGIRKVSDTLVIVDAKMVQNARKDAAGKWLEAFDALEQRLLGLEPIRLYCGMAGCRKEKGYSWEGRWVFTDDADGQEFVQVWRGNEDDSRPAEITQTETMKSMQNLANFVQSLAETGSVDFDTFEQPFQLFDDGWRLMQSR